MKRDEIRSRLMDLVDGTLPSDEARAVEEALEAHPDLRREADDLRAAIRLAAELTPVETPSGLGSGIRAALDRGPAAQARRAPALPLWFVGTAAAAILLIAVILIVDRRRPEEPELPSRVAREQAPSDTVPPVIVAEKADVLRPAGAGDREQPEHEEYDEAESAAARKVPAAALAKKAAVGRRAARFKAEEGKAAADHGARDKAGGTAELGGLRGDSGGGGEPGSGGTRWRAPAARPTAPAAPASPAGSELERERIADQKGEKKAKTREAQPTRRTESLARLRLAEPAQRRAVTLRVSATRESQAREALLRFLVDREVDARWLSPEERRRSGDGFFFGRSGAQTGTAGATGLRIRLGETEARGLSVLLTRFGSLEESPPAARPTGAVGGTRGARGAEPPAASGRAAGDKKKAASGESAGPRAVRPAKTAGPQEWILIILRG